MVPPKGRTFEEMTSPLQRLGGYCWVPLKGMPQIRAIKNAKDELSHRPAPGRGPQRICLLDLGPKSQLARPLGLGHEFRLARPPQRLGRRHCLARPPLAPGVNSVSPDPSRARAPTPLRPTRARLPTHGARTHDVTGAVTPISQQGMVATMPTTPVTAASLLSL